MSSTLMVAVGILAIFGPAVGDTSAGEERQLVSVIQPEYVTETVVQARRREAHGEVSFRADGFYAGRVRYVAVFDGTSWRITELSYPASNLRVVLTESGWRLAGSRPR